MLMVCYAVFKTISLPNELASARFNIRTSVFGGLLALLCDDDFDRANKSCSIWIMKEYGIVDSWYKYVKVDLTGGIKGVIGILKNGHILIEGDTSWSWELSSYDPRNKEIKKLGIKGTIGRFHVDTYEENLILLNKTDAPVSRRGGCRKRKDRLMLDQSTHARMEAQALATDAKRLKQEFVVLRETVEEKMGVVREVVAKMWPQQFTELRSKLQTNFPNFLTKDGQGNEETNSTRLTSTSQNSVVKDCEVAEKLSHSCVLGRGENVKGNHSNGCTSSGQGCSDKDRTRDEDMEFWRKDLEFWRKDLEGWIKLKAEYAHFLEQISEFDQILRTILP